MKYPSVLLASLLLFAPLAASAHEHRTFTIGTKSYSIVIGSLNEPVRVDDKTGVELMVSDLSAPPPAMAGHDDGDDDGPSGTPVEGLESTLKVEVSAGDQKKTFDLKPTWGTPGSYEAVFYPTVQTTYSYRLMGTINNVPFDVAFACNPAGHPVTQEETTPAKVSDQVTQTMKGGAFGCPQAKADAEFPVQAATVADLTARVTTLEASAQQPKTDMGKIGFILGAVGIALGAAAWLKANKRS